MTLGETYPLHPPLHLDMADVPAGANLLRKYEQERTETETDTADWKGK